MTLEAALVGADDETSRPASEVESGFAVWSHFPPERARAARRASAPLPAAGGPRSGASTTWRCSPQTARSCRPS